MGLQTDLELGLNTAESKEDGVLEHERNDMHIHFCWKFNP